MAKRIESISREGKHTGILHSGPANLLVPDWIQREKIPGAKLKGFESARQALYEIKNVFDLWDLMCEMKLKVLLDRRNCLNSLEHISQLARGCPDEQWLSLFTASIWYKDAIRLLKEPGKLLVAIERLRKGLNIAPDWWRLHNTLGESLMKDDKRKVLAPDSFKKACELQPSRNEPWWNHICSLIALGDMNQSNIEKAKEIYRAGQFDVGKEGSSIPKPKWKMPSSWRELINSW